MLWAYGHYKYFNSYSAGIDFSHQNLRSTDVRRSVICNFPGCIYALIFKFICQRFKKKLAHEGSVNAKQL